LCAPHRGQNGYVPRDWARYWRSADEPLEAMHAHFERHVYHRHSHDGYSLGVTESGAQTFSCRGSAHTSAAGMVMAFNPDDPHDGHASDEGGFTYRMIHIGPGLVASILSDTAGRRAGLPLFADPVTADATLAARVRALHRGLLGGAPALRCDELLAAAVGTAARRAAVRPGFPVRDGGAPAAAAAIAAKVRELISDRYLDDLTAGDLAAAAGRSRFTVHRAFVSAYGMAPSDYQRQLRLRAARALIARGTPISEAAAQAGFADQSHLTRWFARCYGVTPASYRGPGRPPGSADGST
jgi:AraC-like DNA-binding protein